jgi:branched-chain amino acid transport system permease protein
VLFLGALLAGGLVAAFFGLLVGLPSLRLRGDYLAIVTLGFGEIVRVLIQSQTQEVLWDVDEIRAAPVVGVQQLFTTPWPEGASGLEGLSAWWGQMQGPLWTKLGGALGFSGLPFYTSYFWAMLLCGLTVLVAIRMKYSSAGRALLSIREDEIAAEAMGVDTTRYKVRAFVVSAFFAGIAGGLFAHTVGVQLNAGELGFVKSFDVIIMVVLGGLGSISGATIAAGILTILPEALRSFELSVAQALGAAAGLVLLIGALRAGWATFRKRPASPTARKLLICGGAGLGAVILASVIAPKALGARFNLGDYRMILYALALILMMIARPKGLLGVREVWELWRKS